MSLVVTCPICDGDAVRAGRGHWVCPACDVPPPAVPTFGCKVCGRTRPVTQHVLVGVGEQSRVMCADCFRAGESPVNRAG